MNQKPRVKKCVECGSKFEQWNTLVRCCGVDCAIAHGKKEAPKQEKAKRRTALKAFNDSDVNIWKRRAIATFNLFIRQRDASKPCVSCGVIVKESMAHASHFKPANTYSYLRFDEFNVHKSCSKCNVFLSGNLDAYRIRIVERIGQEQLDRLDLPNKTKRWTIEELKEIVSTYKSKTKELQ